MGPTVTINVFMQRYWVWGAFGCKLYGFMGAVCGVASILSMVVIGYDRYNVIVKGFNGAKITEGKLFTCSYDYLKDDWNHKSYVLFGFFFCYMIPMVTVFFFYSSIVKAVWAHEHALREQAKKMNVDSL